MKKIIFIALIIFLFASISVLPMKANDFNQNYRLATLCKAWGFLKYYHPNEKKGEKIVDWDKVLIDTIQTVKNTESREEFNQAIRDLIREKGGVNFLNIKKMVPNLAHYISLHNWFINDTILDWDIIMAFRILINNDVSKGNYYQYSNDEEGIPSFYNEVRYNESFPDENHRLLSLFRYWNIIKYFYPFKDIISDNGTNWDEILQEFLPKIISAANDVSYQLCIKELTVKINDAHSFAYSDFLNDYWGNFYPPLNFRYIEGKTVVVMVLNELLNSDYDIKPGDIITKVNGEKIDECRKKLEKYVESTNDASLQRNINSYAFRTAKQEMTISLSRDGIERDITIPTFKDIDYVKNPVLESWKMLEDNIGYINMGNLELSEVDTAIKELMKTRAIIFDIRNYPKGTGTRITELINVNSRPYAVQKTPKLSTPGNFDFTDHMYAGPRFTNENYYRGKVLLLINERTQSHAEFTCMQLESAYNVTIIGSQTAGTPCGVAYIYLPGEIKTYFSMIETLYPGAHVSPQKVGIIPDIEVKPTIKGIIEGRDEVLIKAIEFINSN